MVRPWASILPLKCSEPETRRSPASVSPRKGPCRSAPYTSARVHDGNGQGIGIGNYRFSHIYARDPVRELSIMSGRHPDTSFGRTIHLDSRHLVHVSHVHGLSRLSNRQARADSIA